MTRTVLAAVPPGRPLPDLRSSASPRPDRISLLMSAAPACAALSPCRHPGSRPGLALSLIDDIYGRA